MGAHCFKLPPAMQLCFVIIKIFRIHAHTSASAVAVCRRVVRPIAPSARAAGAAHCRALLPAARSSQPADARRQNAGRKNRARITHQADDGIPDVCRAEAKADPADAKRAGLGTRMESRRLAHVYPAESSGDGRGTDARHDRAVRQRRVHRAGRADRRQRRNLRAKNECPGAAVGHEELELHELDRAAQPAALFHRAGPGAACHRHNPRFSRIPSAIRDEGIPLQQHHPGQPQPPLVVGPDSRRHENRLHGERRLLPHYFGEARRTPADFGGGRHRFRIGARDGKPEAAQLRVSVL